MTSAERFVIETVFEDYGRVRVFEIIDRGTVQYFYLEALAQDFPLLYFGV